MENKINLRKHNLETYKAIKEAYLEKNHVAVVQATGTGKSYLIANTIEDMKFDNVLFLTSSLHIINEFKANFKFLNKKVTYMTYRKLSYIKDLKAFLEENEFDFVVLDEYHRCGAKTWNKPVRYIVSSLESIKILGVTATPVRYLDNNRDMTKELFDSEPIVEISLLNAIELDVLPKPKYVLSYYNIKNELEALRLKKLNHIKDNDTLKNINYMLNNISSLVKIEDVLSNNITKERKFIVFCNGVNHLEEMSKIVPLWFKDIGFETEEFYMYRDKERSMTTKDLELELEKFKESKGHNKVSLLFVINILNEGVHLDDIDGLIFLRKTTSPTIVYQQLGRALKSGGNNNPLIFDFVSNISELSFADKDLRDIEKINCDIKLRDYTLNSDIEIIDYTRKINELLIELEEKSRLTNWKNFIDELKEYKNTNGTCNVPSNHILYKRCVRLRNDYKQGVLNENKIKELDALGFKWEVTVYNEELWDLMFNKLLEFKAIYNHVDVPRSYKDKQLATWVHTQRKYRDTMLEYRKDKLLSVGFNFSIAKSKNDKEWEDMYSNLLEFKQKFNHVDVSSRYEDKKLANWVNSQRKAYKANKLSDYRYNKLVDIGFKFSKDAA